MPLEPPSFSLGIQNHFYFILFLVLGVQSYIFSV